jgi:hypothetical protein
MSVGPRFGTGNPLRGPVGGGNLSIESRSKFEGDKGQASAPMVKIGGID